VSDDAAAIVAGSPRLNVAPRTLVHIDRHPDLGEFRITVSGGTESGASYTADRDDAIRTARNKGGAHCVIEHRTLRYRRGRAAAPAGRALPRRRDIPTSTT
jgi:hypothetical protein